MSHLSPRFMTIVAIPALSVALAACGGTAINSNYTPGPSPQAGANMGSTPTKAATKKPGKAKATTHASSAATHSSTSKTGSSSGSHHSTSSQTKSTAPGGSSGSGGSGGSGSGGGTHHVTPTGARITVTPSSGLADSQTVTIHGYGFEPGKSVIAIECVDYGNNTGPNDCNMSAGGSFLGIPSGFKPAADGTFTKTLTVKKTFKGLNGQSNTCGSPNSCLVSVTEASNNPTEEADAPISFR